MFGDGGGGSWFFENMPYFVKSPPAIASDPITAKAIPPDIILKTPNPTSNATVDTAANPTKHLNTKE